VTCSPNCHTAVTDRYGLDPFPKQASVEEGITVTTPRTTRREINRHKASNYDSKPR
jgi:hypothetical protein